MALYIPHSIFHLPRLLYVRPETFGPYCVSTLCEHLRRVEVSLKTGCKPEDTPVTHRPSLHSVRHSLDRNFFQTWRRRQLVPPKRRHKVVIVHDVRTPKDPPSLLLVSGSSGNWFPRVCRYGACNGPRGRYLPCVRTNQDMLASFLQYKSGIWWRQDVLVMLSRITWWCSSLECAQESMARSCQAHVTTGGQEQFGRSWRRTVRENYTVQLSLLVKQVFGWWVRL